jgi:hypothetical protein
MNGREIQFCGLFLVREVLVSRTVAQKKCKHKNGRRKGRNGIIFKWSFGTYETGKILILARP